MRAMVMMFSCFVVCLGGLVGHLSVAHAQSLPDLMVTDIACQAPGKVAFTVRNASHYPLPTNWNAMADVYVDGVKKGSVNLKYPTSGSIVAGGSFAHYLTGIYISRSSSVKVVVDPLNTVREWTETNNSRTETLAPCASTPDPNVSLDYQQK